MDRHALPADAPETIRRLAFLAKAGEVLSSSLDYEEILQHVARLAIPTLGDLCIVDVVEDGGLRRVATTHADPAKAALLDQLRRMYPAEGESPQPAARVMRSGAPELLAQVTPDVVAAHTRDPEHAALIRAIGIRSHVAVPLVARGTIVGVISFGVTDSSWQYGPDDVTFAEDLARRAALAVDNARLYRVAQRELAERRRVEEALRLSEGRFRAVMEQSPLSTQIFDSRGVAIRVNRAWEDLWGVTLDKIPEYNILEDPQLERLGIAPLVRRAFAGEAVELPAIRYDPEETLPDRSEHADPARWVSAVAYPVKDEHGAVREVVLVHEDVTATRTAEEKLRASEERLRLALVAGRMNVWDWDLDTDRVQCSDNAAEFWGIEVGTAADFINVIHPDDRALVAAATESALAGGPYLAEYRLTGAAMAERWVQSRGRLERAADGRPIRLLGITLEITELKRAQESTRLLADAGETLGASLDYATTLRNLSQVVMPRFADWYAVDLVNEAGSLQRVSVSHRDPDRVTLAATLFARYPPKRSSRTGVWRVIESGEPEWVGTITDDMLEAAAEDPDHLRIIRELGLRSYICVPLLARGAAIGAVTLIYAESGRRYEAGDVNLAMDLARRAAAAVDNAQLYDRLRSEDRRKDEFLATLAHELRNPLAPIRTGLALLRASRDPVAIERTRDIMDRQVGHMVRLIDDLLDLSRVTRGKVQLEKERIDLRSVVETALETSGPLLEAAGLALSVALPDGPVVLEADRTRLAQVLSNLLNNSAKYTERGGGVVVSAAAEGDEVIIQVSDNGIGIPPEMLERVFDMFTQVHGALTRSQGGLGIGLTLVKRLVELHGGHVWAESAGAGAGSTFFVRLPIAHAAGAAARGTTHAIGTEPDRPRRVLVVDDNEDAAETFAALLRLDGHEVRTAANGTEALQVVSTFLPDLAFLDIGMPGMSGYELARHLRKDPRLKGMTLAAVTGWGQAEDRRQSEEAGFDHHLTKPVEPSRLRALVATVPGT